MEVIDLDELSRNARWTLLRLYARRCRPKGSQAPRRLTFHSENASHQALRRFGLIEVTHDPYVQARFMELTPLGIEYEDGVRTYEALQDPP